MPKKAKNITLKDWNDKPIDFFKYQGKNYLLLVFYRGYWCNICRHKLGELSKKYAGFKKKGIRIIAVSGDEPLYASLLSTHLKAKFPILPDPELKFFKTYGLKIPKDKKDIFPIVFLVSPEREIIHKHISKSDKDRPDFKEILKKI